MENMPRRTLREKLLPLEVDIMSVIGKIETMGADERLTEAQIKLNEAFDKIADFYDRTPEAGYYLPSVEEFHAGFEYQWYDGVTWRWRRWRIDTWLKPALKEGNIRVPVLSVEDVKDCGWVQMGTSDKDVYNFLREDIGYDLTLFRKEDFPEVHIYDRRNRVVVFRGRIRNKSELNRVVAMAAG